MSSFTLTRRDVLKLALLGLGAIAWRPLGKLGGFAEPFSALGRITIAQVPVHSEPDLQSPTLGYLRRDQIVRLHAEFVSPYGPPYNPRWYRLAHGYIHTAYVQRVEVHINKPAVAVPEKGRLAEVSVPYTRAWRRGRAGKRIPVYRLYYGSVHWVTATALGDYGEPLYELTDDLLGVSYFVYAPHLRLISDEELAPISPDVPKGEKRIEVDLAAQELIAYEYDKEVYRTKISSGIPSDKPGDNGIPTRTPSGHFHIFEKWPTRHMGEGALTSALDAYELPGVPWVSFFVKTGVAFHGTYWHDNFGRPMSHGCINMRNSDAKWLFRWSTPINYPPHSHEGGYGTRVWVHE